MLALIGFTRLGDSLPGSEPMAGRYDRPRPRRRCVPARGAWVASRRRTAGRRVRPGGQFAPQPVIVLASSGSLAMCSQRPAIAAARPGLQDAKAQCRPGAELDHLHAGTHAARHSRQPSVIGDRELRDLMYVSRCVIDPRRERGAHSHRSVRHWSPAWPPPLLHPKDRSLRGAQRGGGPLGERRTGCSVFLRDS